MPFWCQGDWASETALTFRKKIVYIVGNDVRIRIIINIIRLGLKLSILSTALWNILMSLLSWERRKRKYTLAGASTLYDLPIQNILVLQPIFGGVNWKRALAFAFCPGLTMMNAVWLRTPEFIELCDATQSSPTSAVVLIRAVTDYMSEEAQLIPVFLGGSGFAFLSYVMDARWNDREAG